MTVLILKYIILHVVRSISSLSPLKPVRPPLPLGKAVLLDVASCTFHVSPASFGDPFRFPPSQYGHAPLLFPFGMVTLTPGLALLTGLEPPARWLSLDSVHELRAESSGPCPRGAHARPGRERCSRRGCRCHRDDVMSAC